MAITKTSTISAITITYGDGDPMVDVQTNVTWDDPNDDSLPVSKGEYKQIRKSTTSVTYDETTGDPIETTTATDYSGEDAKVVAICDLIWADSDAE